MLINPPSKNGALLISALIVLFIVLFTFFIKFSATASLQETVSGARKNRDLIARLGNPVVSKALAFAETGPVRKMKPVTSAQPNRPSAPVAHAESRGERGTLVDSLAGQQNPNSTPRNSSTAYIDGGPTTNIGRILS